MSHVLVLILLPFVGLVLWEHFGTTTSRPSVYLAKATVLLVAFAQIVAILWARLSDFISWLQLYKLAESVYRLARAFYTLITAPIAAGHDAYWDYVYRCTYPGLVVAGSLLIFIAFELLVAYLVYPFLDLSSLSPKQANDLIAGTLTALVGIPTVYTVVRFDYKNEKRREAQQEPSVAAASRRVARVSTPRPPTRLSPDDRYCS